jgi:uncharacterized BrkB/YihY/UPF0761 family membrane protein
MTSLALTLALLTAPMWILALHKAMADAWERTKPEKANQGRPRP